MGKLSRTSSVHFVPSSKEVSDTVIDVIVDGPVCSLSAAIAEVRRPAAQKAVQFITHFRPRPDIAGNHEFTDLVLDPLHALRGWACTQVPTAVFSVAMWSERVSRSRTFTPTSRRTVRDTLASHSSHQANVPVIPSRQCTKSFAFSRASL